MIPEKTTGNVLFKDTTLREGLDTPGVAFSLGQKLHIIKLLDQAGVPEAEIIAPSRVLEDLTFAGILKKERLRIRTSGLIYAYSPRLREEIAESAKLLDRIDLLLPVSSARKPYDKNAKIQLLREALQYAKNYSCEVGVGFPHATQVEENFLLDIIAAAEEKGTERITIYDTNGNFDPFETYRLIGTVKSSAAVPVLFHGHNDLGLATANSISAVYAGADCLDVTVNGLGDRAGNAALEQLAVALRLKGFDTGVMLHNLKRLSETVEQDSGVKLSKLAPVVGAYIFRHKSPSHLKIPELFEAFDPRMVGFTRSLDE